MPDDAYAGRFEGRAHLLPVRIYYEDTDFTGVVYHANYLRYCERGRSDFLRLAGVNHVDLLEDAEPIGFAVQRMTIDFKRGARIDDSLVVRTTFDLVKGARLFISQDIMNSEQPIFHAAVEACCISLTGKPKRPPQRLVERLGPYLDPARS